MKPLLPFSTILSRERHFGFSPYSGRDISREERYRRVCDLSGEKRVNRGGIYGCEYVGDDYLKERRDYIEYYQRKKEIDRKREELTPGSLFNEVITNAIEEGEEVIQLSYVVFFEGRGLIEIEGVI